MKPKTNRRLIVLLTFMLADYNVLASLSCLNGCKHDTRSCESTATGCSDGEICSRFQMEEVDDGMDDFYDFVAMQCMSKEECKTNKEATQSDLETIASNLKALTGAGLFGARGKIEFACCDQNDCNLKPVSEMKIDQVEASGAGGLFENHLMFYMALGLTIIYFSS